MGLRVLEGGKALFLDAKKLSNGQKLAFSNKGNIMFMLDVFFGPNNAMIRFMFDSEVAALDAAATVMKDHTVADNIGQIATFGQKPHAVAVRTGEADIALGLHQARTQVKANQAAGADPLLRLAVPNGPRLVS